MKHAATSGLTSLAEVKFSLAYICRCWWNWLRRFLPSKILVQCKVLQVRGDCTCIGNLNGRIVREVCPAQSSLSLLFIYFFVLIFILALISISNSVPDFIVLDFPSLSSRHSPSVEMAASINRQQPQLPSDREIIEACDRNPPGHENGDSITGLMYSSVAQLQYHINKVRPIQFRV
jgi:hypothetical protein